MCMHNRLVKKTMPELGKAIQSDRRQAVWGLSWAQKSILGPSESFKRFQNVPKIIRKSKGQKRAAESMLRGWQGRSNQFDSPDFKSFWQRGNPILEGPGSPKEKFGSPRCGRQKFAVILSIVTSKRLLLLAPKTYPLR